QPRPRACAPRRRAPRRRAARGGRRPEPRVQRGRARPRLDRGDAVPDDVLSGALGHPESQDHGPRARRRRPFRDRAAGAVRRLFAGGWTVTCDEAGTEHEAGWVLVEEGVVTAVGASGHEPEVDERVDLTGTVVTPGLVNTHYHLYQTLTRERAQEA